MRIELKEGNYVEAVGRRKMSVARVRLFTAVKSAVSVNKRELDVYFKTPEQRRVAGEALTKGKPIGKFQITACISGGGLSSQAEALRHGIARALVRYDADLRKKLKKAGFLKRDQRSKERRKFGLKKARKSPQWSKR